VTPQLDLMGALPTARSVQRLKSVSPVHYTTPMVPLRVLGWLLWTATVVGQAQNAPPLNDAYDDALQLRTLIKDGSVVPNWQDDHRFWFEDVTVAGAAFIVDPVANTKAPYLRPRSSGPTAASSPGIESPDGKTLV
jgi:hypothetical protein